jgi:cell division protein FtsI/penicillin-binding protein 2
LTEAEYDEMRSYVHTMLKQHARPLAALLGGILAAAGLAGCGKSGRSAQQTIDQFLSAWNRGDTAAMAKLIDRPSPTFSADLPALTAHLEATSVSRVSGTLNAQGSGASAPLTQTYQIPDIGSWTDQSVLRLTHRGRNWLVAWSPATVDSSLQPSQHLSLTYRWPPRAAILGAGGAPLVEAAPQVIIGIEGSHVKDPAHLTTVLESAGATAAQVSSALAAAAAHPTFFEPVVTVSEARYQQLGGNQGALYSEPGTVFQNSSARAAVTPGLGQHVVGSVGPITAEQLKKLGPPYGPASVVGQTGLEAAYEKQLAGKPGGTISVVDSGGQAVKTIATFAATPGTPVTTTIDPGVQAAAEAATAGVTSTTAMVAVRVSTGQVLASVSLPGSTQFDEALGGEFPPGSSFKILTSTALFEKGLTPTAAASCPPTITVDGEGFHNAEGDTPVSNLGQAFTESCNTAFVQLATAHLQPADFPAVAGLYGIGASWSLGLPAFSGRVLAPKDQADLGATAIGQGSVVVSPLAMAMVAAAVGSGTVRSPQLVTNALPNTSPPNNTGGQPLPSPIVDQLRSMMASVVSSGTAAGTGLPAGTYAKTGTAEYGSGNPLPTDAWLVGYKGDVAFAMVVQNSAGNGGPVDGPIVAKFLDALPAAYK